MEWGVGEVGDVGVYGEYVVGVWGGGEFVGVVV